MKSSKLWAVILSKAVETQSPTAVIIAFGVLFVEGVVRGGNPSPIFFGLAGFYTVWVVTMYFVNRKSRLRSEKILDEEIRERERIVKKARKKTKKAKSDKQDEGGKK